jgi:hypothetical protein
MASISMRCKDAGSSVPALKTGAPFRDVFSSVPAIYGSDADDQTPDLPVLQSDEVPTVVGIPGPIG